jgi:PAS domain S-box-containing protein
MMDVERLFTTDGFMPHGMCYMWRPAILAVHVGADSLIALAYFTIPFTLLYFVRKRVELRFGWIFSSFAIFIVACGISHVMEIWTIWYPMYWLSGAVKVITALASVMTAILLIKLVPIALRLPSPSALQAANDDLARQVSERQRAENRVLALNAVLETRVAERTSELAAANQALTEINGRCAIAAQAAELGFWDFDVAAQTLHWDDQTFKLYGRHRDQGAQPYELWTSSLHPEDRAHAERTFRDALDSGDNLAAEFRIILPNGETRHIRRSAAVVRDASGVGMFMHGVSVDVTMRRRADAQFRLALEAAPTGMLMVNEAGTIVLLNAQIEALFGYPRDELMGQELEMLVPERYRTHHPDLRRAFAADPGTRAMGAGRELYGLRKDGTEVPIEIGLNPLQTSEGLFVLSSIADISERKRTEGMLRALNSELEVRITTRTLELRERESLLQEIHHRVKNNLQVISSLINMQIRGLGDESGRAALRDCKSRVMTMAQIHEMLYQSADYARVPFAKYAKDLVTRIVSASGTSPGNVSLQFELDELSLPVAKAIPCGLILNELVANSLKHAFPNAAKGTIRVELRLAPAESVVLSVGDDGIGIAPELDLEKMASLGVQLVMTLVEQLEGSLEIVRRPGSTFRITFPRESAV